MAPSRYRRTMAACCCAYLTQAAVVCLPPLLFMPLRSQYGLSYTMLGALIFVNFVTQVLCDLLFSRRLDRHGCRPFVLCASVLVAAGFCCYVLTPVILPGNVCMGLFCSTVIFSGAGGLLEITLSPIIDRITAEAKGAAMSFLHSFYAWGQVLVVAVTTVLLSVLGNAAWRFILLGWIFLPAVTFILFTGVPLAPPPPAEHAQRMRPLFADAYFRTAMLAIAFGSAAELCVAQWSSSFMERGVGLPKLAGDLLGTGFFALMLGIGRLLYGLFGAKLRLSRVLAGSCLIAAVCYLTLAFCHTPAAAIAACGLTGLSTSLLWPGTLVLAGERYPMAGAWMFAILSCAGDIGGSAGPWLIGILADAAQHVPMPQWFAASAEQSGFRLSVLAGTIFPLAACFCYLRMSRSSRKKDG